ncbi:MAG: DUF1491 domain-containing protein [Hyphomicrobium sp.]|jgi:hypothetical protein|nr:DUF1491 domain-containing protein [Hyphomicrobium sp.]PPD06154.1 MAG: hypothetical protein CTY28_14615 [Hyphomicrobium sp.]
MRLKAGLWIKAYIRRLAGEGIMAVVMRHGDDDAGAIFVRVNRLDGTSLLFGPAPAGLDESQTDRPMMALFDGKPAADDVIDAYLARQRDFDSDLWIVDVEARDGRHLLDDWVMHPLR